MYIHVKGILHYVSAKPVGIIYVSCVNRCHQIKRIAFEYIQEGYNIFRQTSFENLPFFVIMLNATQLMMQIEPVLELSQVETRCSSLYRRHISVARVVCFVEQKQTNIHTGHILPTYECTNHHDKQVIEQIGCIYYRSRIIKRVLTNMKFILIQIPHVSIPAVKIREPTQLVYSIGLFLQIELAIRRNWHNELSILRWWSVLETYCVRTKLSTPASIMTDGKVTTCGWSIPIISAWWVYLQTQAKISVCKHAPPPPPLPQACIDVSVERLPKTGIYPGLGNSVTHHMRRLLQTNNN